MYQDPNSTRKGGEADSYQGGGGNYPYYPPPPGYQKPDVTQAAQYAKQQLSDDDDDNDKEHLFSSVLSKLMDRQDEPHKQAISENEAQRAAQVHDQVYNQSQPTTNSRDLGAAAAMQAFKMFTGGGNKNNNNGGGSSSQLIGLAMGEAMKLFNSQGGKSSGANQSEMLQQAALVAMQLFMTQQAGKQENSGGLGQVMNILGSLTGQPQQAPPPPPPEKHSSKISGLLGKFF